MMNKLAKVLVLLQAAFSISAMTWAISVFLLAKDLGWKEPAKEVLEYTKEGAEKTFVRHASAFEKSAAAYKQAARTRDLTMVYVKPALDTLQNTEPFLPDNHLFFMAELDRLRKAEGLIEVRRLTTALDVPKLGKPVFEKDKVEMLNKSYKTYVADQKKIFDDISMVEGEITKLVIKTRDLTRELTGTDDENKYVHPGLYQLIDMEYKAQTQLKVELDEIKPAWSKKLQEAQVFLLRRSGLEESLQKLEPAKNQKK